MNKIRIDSGVKSVEVNDAGECIQIPINDAGFYDRFAGVIKYFEKKQEDIDNKRAELNEKYKDSDVGSIDKLADSARLYKELCDEVCEKIDSLFGAGCCKKVFCGLESPSIELIGDFFEQITPLLQKFADERNEKIDLKYNRNRKIK